MNKFIFAFIAFILFSTSVHADVPQSQQQMQMSFAPLVKKTGPAVVNIYTKRVVRERMRVISPFFNDPFFSQFFNGQAFMGPERDRIENALGSGVIVDADGTIATNHHVIKDADEITVVTADGREYEAKKLLDDDRVDLAVLKIDTKGEELPYLQLTDSDAVQVGDLVLAIGNPFGVGQTVTSGIVSGLARTNTGISDYGFFIQTDAAINPGNSGGALVDMRGRMLGINTAIFSKDGGSLGIGFAIPANMVASIIRSAHQGGKVVHPWVGVTSQNITPDMVESLGLKKSTGTLINKIYPGGPADKAGLKVGDVILAINGKELEGALALRYRLAMLPMGTPVTLSVLRDGKERNAVFVTAPPPENPPRDETVLKGANPLSGSVVVNISPSVIEEFGSMPRDSGVVVIKSREGNAARLGIEEGDIILSVNENKIDSVSGLKSALRQAARRWQMQILRDGRVLNMVVSG